MVRIDLVPESCSFDNETAQQPYVDAPKDVNKRAHAVFVRLRQRRLLATGAPNAGADANEYTLEAIQFIW